jgi:uncharacterized delta-60 repeat protein
MKKITTLFVMLMALLSITTTFAQEDGSIDLTFNPIDEGGVNRIRGSVYEVKEQADGKVLVVGLLNEYLGQDIHNIIRLNADETLDTSFNPGTGANGVIRNVLPLQDGKIIISGSFFNYNGTTCRGIVRLNADGGIDNSFSTAGLPSGSIVLKSIVTPDGKIVVLYLTATYVYKIARLNADGTLDAGFNQGTGTDSELSDILVQADGKVLVRGLFSSFSDVAADGLVRLSADGTVDTGFNLNFPAVYNVQSFALREDGKITVLFTEESGNVLLRYNADGSLDNSFTAPDDLQYQYATGLVAYTDNKLFITHQGVLKRLNDNGSYDTMFTSPNTAGLSYGLAGVGQDGKFYITGGFVSVNDILDNGLARLNGEGSRDNTFNTGANAFTGADTRVTEILKQGDKLIISGDFMSYNGVARKKIARLNTDGIPDLGFVPDNSLEGEYRVAGLYPGGKVLITIDGVGQIKRLNINGSIDTSFNAQQFTDSASLDSFITSVLVLPDGKIIVAGSYTNYGTTSVTNICRLNTDGSLDSTFSSSILEDASSGVSVKLIDMPNEQKILVGTIGASSALYKIDYNGVEDIAFNHVPSDLMFWVDALAVENDGKILVAGYGNGEPYYHQRLIRFNADGTINQTFIDRVLNTSMTVAKIYASADGKFYVAAMAAFFQPLTGVNFARYNNDGTLDDTFITGNTNGYIYDFVFQGNSIVAVGGFNIYNGVAKNNILRLNTSGALATETPQAITENVFVYRDKENVNVSALSGVLKNVQVYDLQGRLVLNEESIYKSDIALAINARLNILIVKTTLTDGTVITKKI